MKDFQVPVGSAIADFGKHLKAYPRTILSSKFGDGKSKNMTMLLGKYQKSQDWMRNSLSLFSLKMLLIRRR